MPNICYFDNAATTKVCDEAANAAIEIMTKNYGNPSSVHDFGIAASKVLTAAGKSVLSAIGASTSEGDLYFTSSGTEAANLAILGTASSLKRKGKRILITDSEHPCVHNSALKLRDDGFDVVFIPTKGGMLNLEYAANAMTSDTILISAMSVNNETGAEYDISALNGIRNERCKDAVLHTDGVQGFLKTKAPLFSSGADLISVSAHKIHAPKGCGALFVKKGVRLSPILFGGGQGNGLRPGTEALPSIAAFASACDKYSPCVGENRQRAKALREYAKARISELCEDVRFNEAECPSPYILSISVTGIRSEIMLRHLSSLGIYVSAGSACSSKHKENRVLTAFGLSSAEADFTLRISFSDDNTEEEVDRLAEGIKSGLDTLMRVKMFRR